MPVYDCRSYDFFKKKDVPPSGVPFYKDELMDGDAVAVGHTIHKYAKDGKDYINLNLVWVALMKKA